MDAHRSEPRICASDDSFAKNPKLVCITYMLLVTGSDPGSDSLGFGELGFAKEGRGEKGAGIPGG